VTIEERPCLPVLKLERVDRSVAVADAALVDLVRAGSGGLRLIAVRGEEAAVAGAVNDGVLLISTRDLTAPNGFRDRAVCAAHRHMLAPMPE
jgi:hypothetical protein